MKNLFKSLLSFVAVAALFAACVPEAEDVIPAGTKISVDLTNIANLPARNVPAVTVQVTADGEWLATTPSWITIDPSHATKSTAVTITVADNVDADGNLQGPREGKIVLTLVDAEVSAEILVAQDGNADLDTRRTYVKVSEITSGKAYLLVAQKAENTFVVPVPLGPTLTYGYPKAKEVTFEADGSIKMEDASYGLIFTDAGRDAAYTIQQPDGRFIWHQGGYNTWSCAADPTEGNLWKLDHVYDDGTVRICDTDAAGVLQYGHGGFDSFAAYGDLDGTSVLPWLYEDTKAAVIDDSKCFFPSTSVKVAADAVEATFEVSANIAWTLEKTEGDWITDFTPKSGDADATIKVTFPANSEEGAEARSATFKLASTDGKKTSELTLTQASPAVYTLAEVIKADAGDYTVKDVLVMAVGGKNIVVADATATMLAYGYATNTTEPKLGDKADISGATKAYNGVMEWNFPIFTVTSSENEIKYPEAVVLDEAGLEAYAKQPVVEYAVIEGIRNNSEYVVLEVGEKALLVNIYGEMETVAGKSYKVYGYTIGYDSKNNKTNFVVTSYEELAVEYDQFELNPQAANVQAAAGKVTFKVVAADNVSWTVSVPEDGVVSAAVADAADGSLSATGTKDVTVTYPANAGEAPVTYTVAVVAAEGANVARKTLTFTINQATAKVSTFAEIIAGEAGEYNAKDALIVAGANKRYVLNDGTAYMFAYTTASVSAGNIVNVSGKYEVYDGCPEWNNPTLSVVSENNEVKHPEPLIFDEAALTAYEAAPEIKYVSVEVVYDGKDKKAGNHVIYTHAPSSVRFESGKTYKILGYAIGYSTKYKNISVVVTGCEEVKPEYLQFELSTTADEVEATAGAKTFQVVAADDVAWSLTIAPAATVTIEGLEPNVMESAGTKNVTINYAANESAAPVNYVVTISTRATVEHPTLTYTLTQKGKEGVETLKFEWRVEADTLVNVAFDAEGAAHWYIERDPAVDYEVAVYGAAGSVVTEGVTIEKDANHIAINYGKNTTPSQKVWLISVTTTNDNVANKTLTAKLVQGAYEYSDLAEFNEAIIADGTKTVDRILVIGADEKLYVTKKVGKNVFAQARHDWFTGGVLFFGTGLEGSVAECNTIYGRVIATTTTYNGVPEITKVTYNKEDVTFGYDGDTWPCEKVTIANLEANYMKYVNVKTELNNNYNGVTVTDGFDKSDRNGKIKDSTGEINLYVQLTDGTITGHVTGTKLNKIIVWPTFYRTNHQIGLWSQPTDVKSIPGIITVPATATVAVGETLNLNATTNSTGVLGFVSTDETVATVDDAGVVTGVAAGTAEIVVTVTADGKYTAGEARVALTVTDGEAAEPKVYALTFPEGNSKGVQNYTSTWSATIDGFTWNIVNFNNNNNGWSYIKCGNKTAASVCEVTTAAAIPEAISIVAVNMSAITAASVNSIKLYVATDAAFTENVQTIDVEKKTDEQVLRVPTPTKNCYYKLEFDCEKGSSNGLVTLNTVKYAE